jgi:hypothetical protein
MTFVRSYNKKIARGREAIMTIAEQLRAERLKYGALSAENATRIDAATKQELDRYIERILTTRGGVRGCVMTSPTACYSPPRERVSVHPRPHR